MTQVETPSMQSRSFMNLDAAMDYLKFVQPKQASFEVYEKSVLVHYVRGEE